MVYNVQDLIYYWEGLGFYDFVLPFLLVFAIVYGVLTYMKIFGNNRAVHTIIAVVIGLLATRSQYFNQFFSELFPRLGIGLVSVIALVILIGLFWSEKMEDAMPWILFTVGFVVAIIVLYETFDILGWTFFSGIGGGGSAGWIITAVLVIGVIVAIVVGGGSNRNTPAKQLGNAFKSMFK